jgi:hypothetical protein
VIRGEVLVKAPVSVPGCDLKKRVLGVCSVRAQ